MILKSGVKKLGLLIGGFFFLSMIYWLLPAPRLIGEESMEGQKISVDSPLTLSFSQWMDRKSFEKAVRFLTPLPGRWDWEGRSTAHFWPEKTFKIDDTIHLTVEMGAESFWGKKIKTPLNLSYTVTGPPFVEFWQADGEQGKITMLFDRPMEEAQKIDPLLILDPSAKGSARWRTPRVLEWSTSELVLSSSYKVKIPAGLKAKEGGETNVDFHFEFKTPALKVISSAPPAGAQGMEENQAITLTFNQPVKLDSVKPGFNALLFPSNDLLAETPPREDGFFNTEVTYGSDQDTLIFKPMFPYQPEEEYRLLVKELWPIEGAFPMENEFELRFKTGASSLEFEAKICAVPRKEFLELIQNFGWQSFKCETPQKVDPLKLDSLQSGTYILSVRKGGAQAAKIFSVSETELLLRRSGQEVMLWAVDRRMGTPVPDLKITLLSYNGEELEKGTTNQEGLYKMKGKGEEGLMVIGESATRWAFLSDLEPKETSGNPRLYFLMDQSRYAIGDLFYFEGWVRRVQSGDLSLPEKAKIRLTLETSAGEPLLPLAPTLGRFGVFYGEGKIPEGSAPGSYTVKTEIVESNETFIFKTPLEIQTQPGFLPPSKEVFKASLPPESLRLNPASRWIKAGEEWAVDLEIQSPEGRTGEGKKVKLHLKGKGLDEKQTLFTGPAPERVSFVFPEEAEGDYVLAAESEDQNGHPLKSETSVWVVGKKFHPEELLILPDQNEYLVGGKARLLLMAPLDLPLLFTLEQQGFYREEEVKMESNSQVIEFFVDETMLPELLARISYWDPKTNQFKTETRVLPIHLREKEIQIQVVHEKKVAPQSNEVTLEIKTADYQGRPIPSQLTLVVTKTSGSIADPLDYFYRGSLGSVNSFDTFYFKTGLKTSEAGWGTFSIPLPNDFLQGKLTVLASSGADRFGKTELPLKSIQPLIILPDLPVFAREGDELEVGASFLNFSDEAIETSAELIAEGIEIKNAPKQTLVLAPQEQKRMEWQIQVKSGAPSLLPLAFRTPLTFATASLEVRSPLRFYSLDEAIEAFGKKELESFAMPSGGYRLTRLAKEADPLWTAYALLLTQKESPETVRFLWNALGEEGLSDDEKVLVLGALAEAGELDTRLTLDFFKKRAKLSPASQGFLLLTLHHLIQAGQKSLEPFIERLKSEIASAVTEGEAKNSVILFALNRVSPKNPLLNGVTIPPVLVPSAIMDTAKDPQSLVITREFPSETLKKGEKFEGVLYFIIPRPLRYAKVELPLPAGLKPVSFEPKIENSLHQMDPDRLVIFSPELPAGVYEIPYKLEAAHAGRYYAPPARVFSLVSPKEQGSTQDGWVEVKK